MMQQSIGGVFGEGDRVRGGETEGKTLQFLIQTSFREKHVSHRGNARAACTLFLISDDPAAHSAIESSGSNVEMSAPCPLPGYSAEFARDFYSRHGLAVRAVGIVVENVTKAYFGAVDNVAMGVVQPTLVKSYCGGHDCELAEIQLYGDVVLRLINFKEENASMSPKLPTCPSIHIV